MLNSRSHILSMLALGALGVQNRDFDVWENPIQVASVSYSANKKYESRSKYVPHQGKKEMARRLAKSVSV